MKSLDIDFLSHQAIPIEMGGLLQKLGEYKGRQDLFQNMKEGSVGWILPNFWNLPMCSTLTLRVLSPPIESN
jgi:hypothetical protein